MSGARRGFARVDAAAPAGTLGRGERVQVMTRGGHAVAEGTVVSAAPTGLVVESGMTTGFYASHVYLFVPLAARADLPWHPRLTEALAQGDSGQDAAASESPVTAADLPADIQQAVAPEAGLGPDGRDRVLAAVGEAALTALRRTSVAADALYGLVDAMQGAAGAVLDAYTAETDKDNAKAAAAAAEDDEDTEDEDEGAEDEDPEAEGAVADAAAALKGIK